MKREQLDKPARNRYTIIYKPSVKGELTMGKRVFALLLAALLLFTGCVRVKTAETTAPAATEAPTAEPTAEPTEAPAAEYAITDPLLKSSYDVQDNARVF